MDWVGGLTSGTAISANQNQTNTATPQKTNTIFQANLWPRLTNQYLWHKGKNTQVISVSFCKKNQTTADELFY